MDEQNNKNNEEQEELVNQEDLVELLENDVEKQRLLTLSGVVLGLSVLMILHNFYSIIKMVTDDSIPLVNCPRTFELDKPVLLKSVYSSKISIDNHIRGFSISFVRSLFPRSVEDLEPFYNYVINHSDGYFKKRYEARLEDKKKIKDNIEVGIYSKFWIANSQKIQIRPLDGKTGQWKVIILGYLHKRLSGGEFEKLQPRIELVVKAVKPTITNPEGLIVDEFVMKQINDPISGSEVEI